MRIAVFAAALLLLVVAVVDGIDAGDRLRADRNVADETGIATRQPTAVAGALAERDPVHRRLRLARLVLGETTDQRWLAELPVDELRRELDAIPGRLEWAADEARAGLVARPTAWAPPMILGARTFLTRFAAAEPTLFSDRAAWQTPLERAVALAPSHSEPLLMSCTAHLAIWKSLLPAERAGFGPRLADCFASADDFVQIVERWIHAAVDDQELERHLPERASAWALVARRALRARDWPAWTRADDRTRQLHELELADQLETTRRLVAGGAPAAAAAAVHSAVASTPPSLAVAPTLAEMIDLAPPGNPTASQIEGVRRHLEWGLALSLRVMSPYSTAQLERLAQWARVSEPFVNARLHLLRDELVVAATTLRREGVALNSELAAPYVVARAIALGARGRGSDGLTELDALPTEMRRWPLVGITRARLEGHSLEALEATSWPPHSWRWNQTTAALDLVAPISDAVLSIELHGPERGVPAEVQIDGAVVFRGVAQPGTVVTAPIGGGHRLVTLTSLGSTSTLPGTVRLHDPDASAADPATATAPAQESNGSAP